MSKSRRIALFYPLRPGNAQDFLCGIFRYARPDRPWEFCLTHGWNAERLLAWRPDGIIGHVLSADAAATFERVRVPVVETAGGVLTLDACARPTAPSGSPAIAEQVRAQFGDPPITLTMKDGAKPTPRNALGPFYEKGAPFRGKVSPPRASGTVVVVSGRVWAFDTKRPLPGAIIDLWHCDIHGNYANAEGDYSYRARIITSETGAYEYESIHPVVYDDHGDFRSPHIHYRIASPGYRTLVTQLFFEGDPKHDEDHLFDASLMVPIVKKGERGAEYETAVFDIVLAKDDGSPQEPDERRARGRRRRRVTP